MRKALRVAVLLCATLFLGGCDPVTLGVFVASEAIGLGLATGAGQQTDANTQHSHNQDTGKYDESALDTAYKDGDHTHHRHQKKEPLK